MKEALYYQKENEIIICMLCPHECHLKNGGVGMCRVRRHVDHILETLNYGVISSEGFDPIEKKPLYNFYPTSMIYSIGSIGCNLRCAFCQNWEIAQTGIIDYTHFKIDITSDQVVAKAKQLKERCNIGIAYTYNEPTVWYEYMYDISVKAAKEGLKNVMVTNGFIEMNPLLDIVPYMDAFNVDLKGYSDCFYQQITKSQITPVLNTLETIVSKGKHLEITYLVIPGENDDPVKFEEQIEWIVSHLGTTVPMHINRYFPCYKMNVPATTIDSLEQLYLIAKKKLDYVYMGNTGLENENSTYCPECNNLLIDRKYYQVEVVGLTKDGKCSKCGKQVFDKNQL